MTRTLGFDGKTCVHPRQIDRVNACFTPSQKEIKNALRVLEALERATKNHTGVCTLDGGMVDNLILQDEEESHGTHPGSDHQCRYTAAWAENR